ncbi:MAG: hypothetical protein EBU82_05415, partial [Flavobacteriia bacterium]|nr:hypothetical protein [Flavobacteriia bacterium]
MSDNKKKGGFSVYWIYALAGIAFIAIQLFYGTESKITIDRKQTLFDLVDSSGVAKITIINNNRADFQLNAEGVSLVKSMKEGEFPKIWNQLKKLNSLEKQKKQVIVLENIGDLGNFENSIEKERNFPCDRDTDTDYLGTILAYLLPFGIIFLIWFFVMRRMTGGGGGGGGGQIFNIGKSKITLIEEAEEDYLFSFKLLAPYADYLVVNISSPNTAGLRALQDRGPLVKLLSTLTKENKNTSGGPVPLLLKVAPDLNPAQLEDILSVVSETQFAGIIATNTTITRPHGTEKCETRGGLSGQPLLEKSLQIVRFLSKSSQGKIPIIGCGGITSAADAGRFMDEGASLVQV